MVSVTTPRASRWDRIVVCGQGHYYHTLWWPLGSFKAVRLGNRRYQRCPVGRHWSMSRGVDPDTLTPEPRREANQLYDVRVI